MVNRENADLTVIVTGGGGRVARALRAVWGQMGAPGHMVYAGRNPVQGIDLAWNIGIRPAPPLPKGAIFLHLAGQTRGAAEELAENRRSAAILCTAAQAAKARHVFFMSSIAVHRPGCEISEDQPPDPQSDYGRAKLAAEQAAAKVFPDAGLTILRLGNLAGADALLSAARAGPVVLDPVADHPAGPARSYIGPQVLAQVLSALIGKAARVEPLPHVLNLAQPPALNMADLLTAAGADWRFGPQRAAVIPAFSLSVRRLQALVDLPPASAESVVQDLRSLEGLWP